MNTFRRFAVVLNRSWFLALVFLLPALALAQEAAKPEASSGEEGGGIMKTLLGYFLVLVGVGLGVAAVVYPTKAGLPPPEPKTKKAA